MCILIFIVISKKIQIWINNYHYKKMTIARAEQTQFYILQLNCDGKIQYVCDGIFYQKIKFTTDAGRLDRKMPTKFRRFGHKILRKKMAQKIVTENSTAIWSLRK